MLKTSQSCEFSGSCDCYFKGSWTCEEARQNCSIYKRFTAQEIKEFRISELKFN